MAAATASSSSNYVVVTDADHFKTLMEQDLQKLSVLNFRADWAEPCAAMDEIAKGLASKHPAANFLEVSLTLYCLLQHLADSNLCSKIEAEALPDISESFDVDAVPYFVLLRVRASWTAIG